MTIERSPNSRRRFLKHAGVFFVTGITTSGSDTLIAPDHHVVAAELVKPLHLKDQAKKVGRAYLKQSGAGKSVESLVETLLESLGFDTRPLTPLSSHKLKTALIQKVHRDYDEEHIAIVKDWFLSETEARLCAILYLEEA